MRRRDEAGLDEHTVSQTDRTREHLIDTYRKKAKHYDITSRLSPVPGYPERAQRLRAVATAHSPEQPRGGGDERQ